MNPLQRGLAFARRLWDDNQSHTDDYIETHSPYQSANPGLHTYHIHASNGAQKRVHLRIEQDASGILFVDVTNVVHLNSTAAIMVHMALNDIPLAQARTKLLTYFRNVSRARLTRELTQMYTLVERIRTPDQGCPTCAIAPMTHTAPLFSTPVLAPYKVDLALTYSCNNSCAHCYNDTTRTLNEPLSMTAWYRVIDILIDRGIPHLIFTGGEATLHPHLPQLIAYANQRGAIVGLNTNGRRLADPAYVATLADAGLNHVQFTLESHRPDVHNAIVKAQAFDQTVQGIRNAIAASLHTITNTTLLRPNCDHIDEMITFLYDLGVRTFALNSVIVAGGGTTTPDALTHEGLAPLLIQVRELAHELGMRFLWYTPTEYCRLSPLELDIGTNRCNAAEYTMCIEPNGDVLPCQSYYVSAGNIVCDSWEHIWNGSLFSSFRNRCRTPQACGLPEQCWECPDLEVCGAGCPLDRQQQKGICHEQSR